MLRIAICDDDKYICSDIEKIIIEYDKLCSVRIDIEVFYTGESLIHFIKNEHKFDLIFLDIELSTISGIDVGNKIRNELDDYISKIVFITSKDGYESQLFDVQPLNFIKKPINEEKLKKCIKLAIKILEIDNKTFEYKKGYDIIKINIKDILYFESIGKRIRIVTHNYEDYFYETLENIKSILPKSFVVPHRAFLVNFEKIHRITKDTIYIINGDKIPISQRNLKTIRNMLIQLERDKKNVRV